MNTLLDTPKKVDYSAPNIVIEMASGIVLSFPVNDNPRLAKGSSAQLRNVEVSPLGLHWPDLDEDLSFGLAGVACLARVGPTFALSSVDRGENLRLE